MNFSDAKQLWLVEYTINKLTPIRCHILMDELPEGVDVTPRLEEKQ